jgi:glyoxylase-like metal-dependent hydrolase (beta-lactamase superfamily II)
VSAGGGRYGRAMRQEQQPAKSEIVSVAPGVHRVQLNVNMPGLGHVNCYVLEDERGYAIVDPGLPSDEAFDELRTTFGNASIDLKRVHTVVITHSHPDHFGGAGRVQKESGAEIVTHRAFRLVFDADDGDADPNTVAEATPSGDAPKLRFPFDVDVPWGGDRWQPMPPAEREKVMENMRNPLSRPRPTVRLEEADFINLGRRRWVALHTPGHTNDHLCLYDAESGTLLSGDHVLPTITPHISGLLPGVDALDLFFNSLRHVRGLPDVQTVLPAHGEPFHNLVERVDQIIEHHHERLDTLARAQVELGRPGTVPEFMKSLFRERSWGSMAESETYAHLEHLRIIGRATVERIDGVLVYDIEPVSNDT